MPTAEIITIGTELLLGETVDTNTRFIARILRNLGIDLFRTQTVGDNAGRIAGTVREAMQRSQIVITTGGLGPTVDDPTRQALADATDSPLEFHPELWEQITARIGRYGRTPTENQKRQAYLPKGAIPIENPVGTAPAFIVETSQGAVITLPGVPSEMETLLVDAVVPYLQNRYSLHAIIKVRTLHISGLGEGAIDDQIGDLETLTNPTVGLTAHSGIVDIRIAAKAATGVDADALIAKVETDLRSRMGSNLFGVDDDTLEGVTLEAVARRGWTLATIESGLEDALMARLNRTGHPVYRGGTSHLARETNAAVLLEVSLKRSADQQAIDIILQTPTGREERHLTYGGHPKNAPRWAINNALDWLRRSAQETI